MGDADAGRQAEASSARRVTPAARGRRRAPQGPLHLRIVTPWRVDPGRVQVASVGPRGDVGLGAEGGGAAGRPRLHPSPLRQGVGVVVRRAHPVPLAVVVPSGLDVARQRRAEAREAGPDGLEPDPVRFPDEDDRGLREPWRSTVHHHRVRGADGAPPPSQHDASGLHALHVPQADDLLHRAQQVELHVPSVGVRAIVGTTSIDPGMTPRPRAGPNRSSSEVSPSAASMVSAASPVATTGSGWTTAQFSIHEIARAHPHDPVRVDAVPEEPRSRSSRSCPSRRPRTGSERPRLRQLRCAGTARAPSATAKGGRGGRGDRRREVGGVHDPTTNVDRHRLPGDPGRDQLARAVRPMVAAAEERDPARPDEAPAQDVVVSTPGSRTPPAPVPGARSPDLGLDGAGAQPRGGDATP